MTSNLPSDEALLTLYRTNTANGSDKWTGNIAIYDRLFLPYKNQPVSILEIGVQNGGSLGVWARYFSQARSVIGVDIDERCGQLAYDDARISVVVGDATQASTRERVLGLCPAFDIIIDDGSHRSGEVIAAFSNFFPLLKDGGIFSVEDLHCSYWAEYDGGLHHPRSSLAFFKSLTDVVNTEHFGTATPPSEVIADFAAISDYDLRSIASISFMNSLCIITKAPPDQNELGARIVTGSDPHKLDTTKQSVPDQSRNIWSSRSGAPHLR
jgi:hypothetical protein